MPLTLAQLSLSLGIIEEWHPVSFALIDWSAVSAVVTAVATLFLVIATYRLFQVTRQLADVSRGLHQAQAMS